MRHLTANLAGTTRRATLYGREYVVAPLSLIVPGVLSGSKGPLYYPSEELSKEPAVWNHMPIVVYHPLMAGRSVSARDSNVLNTQGVGIVLNAQISQGKLIAEGWFEVDAMRRVDQRILNNLEIGQPIELSTGLYTDDEPAPSGAVFNGSPYEFIARNYRPDHLAVLPDQIGACSIADGCGVLVNESKTGIAKHGNKEQTVTKERKELVTSLIANSDCWDEDDRETLTALDDAKLSKLVENAEHACACELVANAAQEGFNDTSGNSHKFNTDTSKWESVIKPKETQPTTNTPAPAAAKPKEKEPQPQTTDEWMDSAPAEIQSAVRNAMAIEAQEKEQLIGQLTANVSDDGKTAASALLKSKPLDELRSLLALLPEPQESNQHPTSNYAGAGPVGQRTPVDNAEDDVLPLPTMSFSSN